MRYFVEKIDNTQTTNLFRLKFASAIHVYFLGNPKEKEVAYPII